MRERGKGKRERERVRRIMEIKDEKKHGIKTRKSLFIKSHQQQHSIQREHIQNLKAKK